MPFYAHLDENNKVKAVTQLSGDAEGNVIELEAMDLGLIGAYHINGSFEHIIISADKAQIAADGVDAAIITAQMPSIFQAANFMAKDGSLISSVPVVAGIAALEVTATSPGDIVVYVDNKRIRVVAV